MLNCPECGKTVSKRTVYCPKCGTRIKIRKKAKIKESKCITLIVVVAILVAIISATLGWKAGFQEGWTAAILKCPQIFVNPLCPP